jgi:hypothetical protein
VWLNSLWFSSLIFSLVASLGAILAKTWITEYAQSIEPRGVTLQENVRRRHRRYAGAEHFSLTYMIAAIPILLHIALFLFFIGLTILDNSTVAVVVISFVTITAILCLVCTILLLFFRDCPFRTPLTKPIEYLAQGFNKISNKLSDISYVLWEARSGFRRRRLDLPWIALLRFGEAIVDAVICVLEGLRSVFPVEDTEKMDEAALRWLDRLPENKNPVPSGIVIEILAMPAGAVQAWLETNSRVDYATFFTQLHRDISLFLDEARRMDCGEVVLELNLRIATVYANQADLSRFRNFVRLCWTCRGVNTLPQLSRKMRR